MAKQMSPNTSIWWVEDVTYDPLLPKVTLLTAAANISGGIASGYSLNPTKSDVDTSKTIIVSSNVETPVRYNYEGSLTFFRDSDLAATTTDFAKAFAFFKNTKKTGYLVRRTGMLSSVVATIGQKVDSFKFISDLPQDAVDENTIQYSVKFLQQGRMELDKAIVA